MNERLLAAFRGSVRCQRESGAVHWCLRGFDRDSGDALEVLLSGAAALQLPEQLAAPELYTRDRSGDPGWELRSGGQVLPLFVRAVQVHRSAELAFAGALASRAAPWRVRAGWALLLNLLRLPGMARVLGYLRGRGRG